MCNSHKKCTYVGAQKKKVCNHIPSELSYETLIEILLHEREKIFEIVL